MSNIPPQSVSLFWKYTTYILYVAVAVFPFTYFNSFLYWGTSTRSALIILVTCIVGTAFSMYLFRKSAELKIIRSPVLYAIAIYFVCLLISGILGLDFGNTFWSVATRTTGLWFFLHLGLLIFFLVHLFLNEEVRRKIILTVVVSTAVYSFLELLSPEGLQVLFFGFSTDAFTFGNSTFAAMYIFGAFVLSLYYLVQAPVRKWWMYVLPVMIVLNPEIINSQIWLGEFDLGIIGEARASTYVILFSLVCLVSIWLVSKIRDTRKRSITAYGIFAAISVSVIFFAISLFSADGYVRQAYLSQSTAARPLVWDIAGMAIQERPFFGWGSDNFERVFEVRYDNRLLQDEYGNEAWFDRAHNVFIDQMVDNGIIGLLAYIGVYICIILCLIYSALKSPGKEDRVLSSLLIVYFSLHLLELQTAFDSSISYFMVAIMISLAVSVFHRTVTSLKSSAQVWIAPVVVKNLIAGVLLVFIGWSFFWGWVPFVRAHVANGDIRRAGSSLKRIPLYEVLFSSPVDQHTLLWRTFTDFQRGIGQDPAVLEDPTKIEGMRREIEMFEAGYRQYINDHPTHFRAHLNLADILIYERLFEIDRLAEAQEVLDRAIELVPQSPQSYWMKAVAYVYMRKFDLAREYAKRGLALNPEIKQSQEVVKYVESSAKTFPNISLYFFRQI